MSPASVAGKDHRHVGFFHELDAWTEYWDVYHPETRGHFYFGDGGAEPGLLTRFLPRAGRPPAFAAWVRLALYPQSSAIDRRAAFESEVSKPDVRAAVIEVDDLVARLFSSYFGDASNSDVRQDYLEAIFRFATNTLPAASERDALIAHDDPRKRTASRHTLDGDIMWFAWAVEIEAAHVLRGNDDRVAMHALMLAGVATGCPANFTWRGHRRTRSEYRPDERTARLLRERGISWASNLEAASNEVHELYRIREWGQAQES